MNVRSKASKPCVSMPLRLGSLLRSSNVPARSSSQLGPSFTLSICLPVIMEKGRADGGVFSRRLPFSDEKSKVNGS